MGETPGSMKQAAMDQPPQKETVSWQEFVDAVNTFRNDYAIVGHDGEPRVGFFDEPREHMKYNVTGAEVDRLNEEQFVFLLKESPIVVVIGCMDRRGQRLFYNQVKARVDEGEFGENVKIMNITMGGGIIQRDEIIRDGQQVVVNRGQALKIIFRFVEQNADVARVIATDHDHRCGAEAYAADGQGWPERLGCEQGAEGEKQQMQKLIVEHTHQHIPQSWMEEGLVEAGLVVFSDDPENNPVVDFEQIGL